MKPLFIPLISKYFSAFKSGEKDTEYRMYGPRWNEHTCYPGRPVVISKGYGKHDRLSGVVESFSVAAGDQRPPEFLKLYGRQEYLRAACIKIRLATS